MLSFTKIATIVSIPPTPTPIRVPTPETTEPMTAPAAVAPPIPVVITTLSFPETSGKSAIITSPYFYFTHLLCHTVRDQGKFTTNLLIQREFDKKIMQVSAKPSHRTGHELFSSLRNTKAKDISTFFTIIPRITHDIYI
jgi:hypothetical protein